MYNKGQQEAMEAIKRGDNVFLTSAAGCGKSFVINAIKDESTVLVAPTGIAALNVGGVTCHSFFGLPFGLPEPKDVYSIPRKTAAILNRTSRIVLDEISILRSDYLDLIDAKLKWFFKNDKPFGGLQMVVVGDFYQLEPIIQQNELTYFQEEYKSPFAFSAKCWNFKTVQLTEVMRQSDVDQINILNGIRKGDLESLSKLTPLLEPYQAGTSKIYLCCYNADADKINKVWFNKNKNVVHTFRAGYSPNWGKPNTHPVAATLQLKVGCKVIMCANDLDKQYVNGQRGEVHSISNGELFVKLDTGIVKVSRHTWEKIGYKGEGESFTKKVEATFSQLPVKLGWAVSVHKSQGMTLGGVNLHTGARGCFSHGQLYVALSRVKDLSTLSAVKSIQKDELIIKKEVKEFMEEGL